MSFKFLFSASTMAGMAAASLRPRTPAFIGRNFMLRNQNKRLSTKVFSSYDEGMGAYKYYGGDHFDMKELKQRIADLTNPFHDVFGYIWGRPKPSNVYVILFNPDTENEGVHTVEYPRGSGNNVILAFESEAECDSFSSVLKDQEFYEPFTQEVNLDFLETYCKSLGVFVQVVPEGMDIRPPTESVENLGHNPSLMEQQHLLNYLFDMGDEHEIEECGIVLNGVYDTNWG